MAVRQAGPSGLQSFDFYEDCVSRLIRKAQSEMKGFLKGEAKILYVGIQGIHGLVKDCEKAL